MNKRKFSWHLHYACNFRCHYCLFDGKWQELVKRNKNFPNKELLSAWGHIYRKYGPVYIEITGGEPFIYPGFTELIKELCNIHAIKVVTNLSADMDNFVKLIDRHKVKISAHFHPLFADIDTFLKKAASLKEAGFKILVYYLAYPGQMRQLGAFKKRFEQAGIDFALAAYRGEYQGKRYPDSYLPEQRELIRPFLGGMRRSRGHLKDENPAVTLCNAGHKYAVVQADGNVARCNQLADKFIGNIMDEGFSLLDEPSACREQDCLYGHRHLPKADKLFIIIKEENRAVKKADNERDPSKVKRRRLGKSELMVSEVGLGGHEYNIKGAFKRQSLEERTKIISKALDLGINFFDAADIDELSSIVGILKKLNARDKCIISYGENKEGLRILNADEKFIREHIENPLKELQTDRIDILRIVDLPISDYAGKMNAKVEEEIEKIASIVNKLKKEGKVRFSCFTTHSQDVIGRWAGKTDVGNLFDIMQIRFNFLECGPIDKIIPYAKAHNMGIVVMKPFRAGTLLNKFCGAFCDSIYSDLKPPSDPIFENLRHKEKGLVYALLKYVLSNQDISTVIPGVASAEQLEEDANVSIIG